MIGGSCDGSCGLILGGGAPRSLKKGGCKSESSDSKSCSSRGGARGKKLETESKKVLYAKAQKYDIKGRATMKKAELAAAIRAHQQKVGNSIAKRGKKA